MACPENVGFQSRLVKGSSQLMVGEVISVRVWNWSQRQWDSQVVRTLWTDGVSRQPESNWITCSQIQLGRKTDHYTVSPEIYLPNPILL